MSVRSISLSGIRFNAASSRDCFLEIFFIELPFPLRSFSGGEDPDSLVAFSAAIRVRDEHEQNAAGQTDRVPAFFVSLDSVHEVERMRVGEDKSRRLKADAVLQLIPSIFVGVSLKLHNRTCSTVCTVSYLLDPSESRCALL